MLQVQGLQSGGFKQWVGPPVLDLCGPTMNTPSSASRGAQHEYPRLYTMARVDPQTRTPIGRRRNKATSLVHTYRADQWASFKATHNPTRVPNCRVPPRGG